MKLSETLIDFYVRLRAPAWHDRSRYSQITVSTSANIKSLTDSTMNGNSHMSGRSGITGFADLLKNRITSGRVFYALAPCCLSKADSIKHDCCSWVSHALQDRWLWEVHAVSQEQWHDMLSVLIVVMRKFRDVFNRAAHLGCKDIFLNKIFFEA